MQEQIILALNQRSHTVMVGDGTNDVGALKHAHVGISLMTTSVAPKAPKTPKTPSEMVADNGQAPLVRLGDASIASPFTYKGDSIRCSIQVLRCGRATLCSVMMMYKIMGLNSVMSAFAMSALTLDGVKLGDGQTAIESLFTSMCFFLVSRSAPAKQLAKQQPISSVFDWPVMSTLACQLLIHLITLFSGWQMANQFRAKDFKRDLEGDFEPNLTNTVVFELMAAMHAASFLANYDGHPFMQPLSANKPLMYSLIFFVTVIVACASEVIPDLNHSLSLVLSPSPEFQRKILLLVVGDIALSFGTARCISLLALHWRGPASNAPSNAPSPNRKPAQKKKKDKISEEIQPSRWRDKFQGLAKIMTTGGGMHKAMAPQGADVASGQQKPEEAYEMNANVEYFSPSNGVWTSAVIVSRGEFDQEGLPCYTVRVGRQRRHKVPIKFIRGTLHQGESVSFFMDYETSWTNATIASPPASATLGYELDVLDEFGKPSLAVAGRLRRRFLASQPIQVYNGQFCGWVDAVVLEDALENADEIPGRKSPKLCHQRSW
eukprot:s100_g7.t1